MSFARSVTVWIFSEQKRIWWCDWWYWIYDRRSFLLFASGRSSETLVREPNDRWFPPMWPHNKHWIRSADAGVLLYGYIPGTVSVAVDSNFPQSHPIARPFWSRSRFVAILFIIVYRLITRLNDLCILCKSDCNLLTFEVWRSVLNDWKLKNLEKMTHYRRKSQHYYFISSVKQINHINCSNLLRKRSIYIFRIIINNVFTLFDDFH